MAFNVLTIRTAEFEDGALYPVLGDERNEIELEAIDGGNVKVLYATALRVHRLVGSSLVKEVGIAEIKASVYITDARVAVACTKYDKGGGWRGASLAVPVLNAASKMRAAHRRKGKVLVGHIRYPWLTAVGSSEKAGYGTTDQLRLQINESIEGTKRKVIFELDFPKGTDVSALAQLIAQRSATYRLRHDHQLADDERAKFEALTRAPRKPQQAKHFVYFEMPTFWFVSKGTAYPKPRPRGEPTPAAVPTRAASTQQAVAPPAAIAPDHADASPRPVASSPTTAATSLPVVEPVIRPPVQPVLPPPSAPTSVPAAAAAPTPARWADDPYNRHESRYWDGSTWTEHVADGGEAGIDRWPR